MAGHPGGHAAVAEPCTVVVAFHNTDDLVRCLDRLDATGPVVVVDNGSEEAVRELVVSRRFSYVDPGRNIGFAAAVNLALDCPEAAGRDVLLLNPDALVDAASVDALVHALHSSPDLAAVCPRLESHGVAQRASWPVPSPVNAWLEAVGLTRLRRRPPEFLVGAVLLLRSDAIADVGKLDERFFLYAEECDWQVRAQRRGWRVRLCEDVVADHAGGRSSSDPVGRDIMFHRSVELFFRKWYGRSGWAAARSAVVLGAAVRSVVRRDAADVRRLSLYLRGPGAVAAGSGR
jgi:GT2 family glycosyltransferase